LILYSIIQADDPRLFRKLYDYWSGANTQLASELIEMSNLLNIDIKMHNITYKGNEFTVFKDMILRDSFNFAKDLLHRAFKEGYDDYKNPELMINFTR
jgi:hypothetical protein